MVSIVVQNSNTMFSYLTILLAIAHLGVPIVHGQSVFKITKADVEIIDNEYFKMDMKVREEGGKSLVDIEADLLKDINEDVFMQVFIEQKSGDSFIPLYKSDVINRCHFTENRDKYPIEKALTDDFDTYGNLLQNCPLKKGHYYLKGFEFIPRGILMAKIAPGEYRTHFLLMKEADKKMQTLMSMRWFLTISE